VNDEIQITLNGEVYSLRKSKLREWIHLESLKDKIIELAERKDTAFSDAMCSYVSIFMNVDKEIISVLPWWEVFLLFFEISHFNRPNKELPIFRSIYEKSEEPPWNYPEREWYSWVDKFASKYGWSIEQIAELEIEDAFALAQEIATNEQLEREWEWARTEIAYPYDQGTKKHIFKPLQRPFWMLGIDPKKPVQTVKIPKHMMPVGNVIRSKSNEDIVN